jgi:DMSO reductase anchor subunit
MHPAPSIILFTTLSGLGYGLAAILGLGVLDPSSLATKLAHILALALIAGGLFASTAHLGNPQRAWRALSQWRSSWLSREGVMALVTFMPLLWSAWACVIESRYLVLPGLIGSLLCFCTVFCTAMIYASLKSVRAWHTPLTPACYLLFSLAGGVVAATFFGFAGAGNAAFLSWLAIAALVAVWSVKSVWRRNLHTPAPSSTPETATGLGHIGKVRLFERPHVTENYLTREMGFKVARKHAARLWSIALFLGGAVPALILFLLAVAGQTAGPLAAVFAGVAVLSHATSVLAERWLFFAEARHAVMNYYGG